MRPSSGFRVAKWLSEAPLVTASACARASTRTASGPPAARARKPSSIHLLRGVRVIAAMASHYHVRELTAPLAVLPFIYTVPYRWRPRYAAPGHRAHLPPLAHPP